VTGRSRRLAVAVAAVAGILAGVVVAFSLSPASPTTAGGQTASSSPSAPSTTVPEPAVTTTTTDVPAPPDATGDEEPVPAPGEILLVWTAGGLPPGLAARVEGVDGVRSVTTVRGAQTDLVGSVDAAGQVVDELADGWRIPIDTLAIDPETLPGFVGHRSARAIRALAPGEAILTRSSAALRGLGAGSTVRLSTGELTVAALVADAAGSGAELLVHVADAERLGVATERFVLLRHDGDRDTVQRTIAEQHLAGHTIRFRTPAETAWMRHGDAVAPQVLVKLAYGEFAYRDAAGRGIEIDPAWRDRWVVAEQVPVLGEVTCHRRMVPRLRSALDELAQANLDHLVDPADFAGCWSPRRIAAGQPISRHAWGIAVDLNVDGNPRGTFSTQDARLVETMRRHGFTWGGTWLVPDPAHYEAIPRP
jgi:hypothetical protein